jgi:hypothetical protein
MFIVMQLLGGALAYGLVRLLPFACYRRRFGLPRMGSSMGQNTED